MTLIGTTVETPFGDMSLIGTNECLHVASFTSDLDDLRERLQPALRHEAVRRGDTSAAAALRDYFAGDVDALARVEVSQPGGAFHTAVWKEMRTIAPGTTLSYSELARQALAQEPPNLEELEDFLTTTTQAALDGGETVKELFA